ncbi:MAG TPA: glycoside hydrolase family 127 protein, partial [Armatimonadota bacterium]|nr:glycoside hydrolase family 127 protein [Armatimonadota bacterium]
AGADPDLSAAFAQQSYQLFLLHGDSRFYDVYERILYNALLAEFQEMTAAMPPDEAEAGDRPAPPSARCLRTLHALPETIYAQNGGQLYVNQYLSSSARFTVNGVELMLRQQGAFPASGHTRLTFATPKPVYSVLLLRVPAWAKPRPESRGRYRYLETDAPQVTVAINGTPIAVAANRLGYLAIPRKWNNGDVVEVALPMPVRRVQPYSYRNNDQVAVECGPFVYGTERTAATPTLGDSAVLTPEAKAGEAAIIHVTTPGTESSAVTLVPYAALSRRPAAVWLARSLPVAPRVDTTDWPAQASAMASTAAASVATAPVAWTPTPPATAPAANQPAPPAPALPLPPTAPVAPIRFRALLIVKPESDLQVDGYLPVRGALSDAAITEVATAFTRDFPALVNRLTNGKVLMETVMVTSPRPLTTLGSDTAGCQLEAADVAQDVQEFAPAGKYDSIFVYYQPRDQRTGYVLPCGYGRASTGRRPTAPASPACRMIRPWIGSRRTRSIISSTPGCGTWMRSIAARTCVCPPAVSRRRW